MKLPRNMILYNKNTFKAKAGSKYDNLYNRLSNLSN